MRRPSRPAVSGGGDSGKVAAVGLVEIRGGKKELIAAIATAGAGVGAAVMMLRCRI